MSRSNSEFAKGEGIDNPVPEYAFWVAPDSQRRIEYSLPLFHELDFQVSEGYRRIPHGGIEIGGFLWGRITGETLRLEAFRQIACEHASGPSFLLSDRDREGASELLRSAHADEELRDFQPVGWFVAHTRGPLTLTDRELALFNEWFPEAGRLTMLVKPERFQPTRFGFVLRAADGGVSRDASANAIILPLPGRASKGLTASIPAPTPKPAPASSTDAPRQPPAGKPAPPPVETPALERAEAVAKTSSDEVGTKAAGLRNTKGLPEAPEPLPGPEAPIRSDLAPPANIPHPRPFPRGKPASATILPEPPKVESEPVRLTKATLLPAEKVQTAPKPVATVEPVPEPEMPAAPPEVPALPPVYSERTRSSSVARLFFLLLVAAALGSGVGYFVYLQLPSPYIPLQADRHANNLVVRWPADQTRDVDVAAYRLNDGQPQLLTGEQKATGLIEVQPPTDNTKFELIAQHWIRDSRGIVRYISEAPPPANPAPTSAPAAQSQESPAP